MADPISFPIFGLLKAIAEGADTQPIRRRYGDYLIANLTFTTGAKVTDRKIELIRRRITIDLPPKVRKRLEQLIRKASGKGKPAPPTAVTVPIEKIARMSVRWPVWWRRGRIVLNAPGHNDPWRFRGWFERPHRIPISRRHRRLRDAARLAAAIWYLRPDLLPIDKAGEVMTYATQRPRRWFEQLRGWVGKFGRREVAMSTKVNGRQRRNTPDHPGQAWPAGGVRQVTAGRWGSQEVRWQRR